LTYLAEVGLLPSYQFPTDTFSLDPGVGDTPTLRRPSWIALFEFAPGNLVYANGHKLKSIRAFFEGSRKNSSSDGSGGGRIHRFHFCEQCGTALKDAFNECPACKATVNTSRDVALLESFEAEENTQINAAEEGRERIFFDRKDHLIFDPDQSCRIFPWEFAHIELRSGAPLLVTNWGRKRRNANPADGGFYLCPSCGRHKPTDLFARGKKGGTDAATSKRAKKWDDDHSRYCNDKVAAFVLGYEFRADALVIPVSTALLPPARDKHTPFLQTLGTALVHGAVELLELEPDELTFFLQGSHDEGWSLIFYETVPGGAGYLESLAGRLPGWTLSSYQRLFGHSCGGACYRCLKTFRNQMLHALLDKALVYDTLFLLSASLLTAAPLTGRSGDAKSASRRWFETEQATPPQPGPDSPIEHALLAAIKSAGRLPIPMCQREFRSENGTLITIADFAYENRRIAIYCDGYAYHGDPGKLTSDALKRNLLQSLGWTVLTFWGRTILRDPARCEEQIWKAFSNGE